MQIHRHPTRSETRLHGQCPRGCTFLGAVAALFITSATLHAAPQVAGDEDLAGMLKDAKPAASAPGPLTSPTAPENKPTSDALGTLKPQAPQGARQGNIALSNGIKLSGQIWTTLDTPFRVWIEESKTYRDLDLSLIKHIEAHVLAQTMEDDWRWLKEGSDQKIYSGKKYPNIDLAYAFTLINDQVVEGAVVAPVYFTDGSKPRTLALYKKYKGKLDETLKDVVFIQSISLAPPTAAAAALNEKRTTKLPLLDD